MGKYVAITTLAFMAVAAKGQNLAYIVNQASNSVGCDYFTTTLEKSSDGLFGDGRDIEFRVRLLYDDCPATSRIEPFLVSEDVESPVGVEVAAEV